VRVSDLVFTSGQIPLDPATGKLVEGGIDVQTRRVMDNLALVLGAAGTSMSRVAKTTIYLVNLADFAAVNAVYGTYFPEAPPARSTVQVAALPLGAAIEIEAIAHVG
jgi:2-iminobutanoate/2-iminopropanoate deaminase